MDQLPNFGFLGKHKFITGGGKEVTVGKKELGGLVDMRVDVFMGDYDRPNGLVGMWVGVLVGGYGNPGGLVDIRVGVLMCVDV